jgi:ATP:corrinoid adenosyltransferase
MRVYLHVGEDKTQAVNRLAMSAAGLRLRTYVAAIGVPGDRHPLTPYAGIPPIDLVHIRLPGLGLPRSYTPADEVATQTVLAVLRQVVASGAYRLVILDGIREAIAQGVLDVADLHRLVGCAADSTEIAMT